MPDEDFYSEQAQVEFLALASSWYKQNNGDYEKTEQQLRKEKYLRLSDEQISALMERLRLWNLNDLRRERFPMLVRQTEDLVNAGKASEAFDKLYAEYLNAKDDPQLVELLWQTAAVFKTDEEVMDFFRQLVTDNPSQKYNIEYKKGLFLKEKKRYDDAKELFLQLNKDYEFSWNYYQIAIMENVQGNTDECYSYLRKAIALDISIAEDAKQFPEMSNLWEEKEFKDIISHKI